MPNNLTESEKAAVKALEDDAGCITERAEVLVRAVARAAADESLGILAGDMQVYGSAVDARVARLDGIIDVLGESESLPTIYEVGAIFRIKPQQAASVLRTYEARFSNKYRKRMTTVLETICWTKVAHNKIDCYKMVFTDSAVLDYAVELLRRHGLARGITIERSNLELYVWRDARTRDNTDAVAALPLRGEC